MLDQAFTKNVIEHQNSRQRILAPRQQNIANEKGCNNRTYFHITFPDLPIFQKKKIILVQLVCLCVHVCVCVPVEHNFCATGMSFTIERRSPIKNYKNIVDGEQKAGSGILQTYPICLVAHYCLQRHDG